jgi:hypothetical protein
MLSRDIINLIIKYLPYYYTVKTKYGTHEFDNMEQLQRFIYNITADKYKNYFFYQIHNYENLKFMNQKDLLKGIDFRLKARTYYNSKSPECIDYHDFFIKSYKYNLKSINYSKNTIH